MGSAYTDAAETQSVTNESITVDYDNLTAVEAADEAVRFNETVTVYNSTDAELVATTDYTWHAGNGSVEWHNTTATFDGEDAAISYEYDDQDEETKDMASVLEKVLLTAGVGLLLFGGVVVLGWLDMLPGGGR